MCMDNLTQLRIICEERTSVEKMPSSDCPDWWLTWEGPAYFGWCYPWAGDSGCVRKQTEKAMGVQVSKISGLCFISYLPVPALSSCADFPSWWAANCKMKWTLSSLSCLDYGVCHRTRKKIKIFFLNKVQGPVSVELSLNIHPQNRLTLAYLKYREQWPVNQH